jgi:hypothetical protein
LYVTLAYTITLEINAWRYTNFKFKGERIYST